MFPLLAILFVLGAVTGSFLNVVIYRLPRKLSLVAPGSQCPRCEQPVKWYDNIPLLSYALLRGQCRHCGQGITMRYPTVELLTAVLWALAGAEFGMTWALLPALLFVSSLVAIFYIDLDHYIIPNVIVLPVAVIGLVANVAISLAGDESAASWQPWYAYLAAGLMSATFFFVVALLKPGGMGMGDVKLAGMMGFFLGKAVLTGLFLGFLFGAVTGVALMATGIKGPKSRIPFGPFLAIGAVIALFFGNDLLDLWTGLFQQ
ncbi:MAG: prepilin peptidase [Thermoleophilia bacterium]|nr:prepilin peptidase [Thermoleophilia bacterium]